jgi:uncharacterized protein (DUF433 family)
MASGSESVIVKDLEILGGEPVFRGTCVPSRRSLITRKGEKRRMNS